VQRERPESHERDRQAAILIHVRRRGRSRCSMVPPPVILRPEARPACGSRNRLGDAIDGPYEPHLTHPSRRSQLDLGRTRRDQTLVVRRRRERCRKRPTRA
jgi:hypothetical protein